MADQDLTDARWYCVNAQGLPMLCASQDDAKREAKRNDKAWPKGAPHRAVQLGDVGALVAERDRLRRVTEMQAVTIEQQAESIQKLMEQAERRKEYGDRLRAQVEDMRTAVHSCHPGCSNARCVAERLRADVRELVELAAETVNEWDLRIVDGDDYAACRRVIEDTMAPLRALLAKHQKEASNGK